jgi:hypothetical protein
MSEPLDFSTEEGLRAFWDRAKTDPRFYNRHRAEFLQATERQGLTFGKLMAQDHARYKATQAPEPGALPPGAVLVPGGTPPPPDVKNMTLKDYKARRAELTGVPDPPPRGEK